MAILKYYKVESDGKIKRLRRECPTPTCGAGVFVRVHSHLPAIAFPSSPRAHRWPSTRIASTAASAASRTPSSPERSPQCSKRIVV
jgi:ribosomal protein S27AE